MQDNVTISHRGSRYEIGRGPGYYGIWRVESAEDIPLAGAGTHAIEWWTENPQGWQDAWDRFTGIEKSSDIVEVSLPPVEPALAGQPAWAGQPDLADLPAGAVGAVAVGSTGDRMPSPLARLVPPVALTFGVLLGLIGLFPGYVGGQALTAHAAEWVPHLFYLAGWMAGAVLLFRGGLRGGALARAGRGGAAGAGHERRHLWPASFRLRSGGRWRIPPDRRRPGAHPAELAPLHTGIRGRGSCVAGWSTRPAAWPGGNPGGGAHRGGRARRGHRVRSVLGQLHADHAVRVLSLSDRRQCFPQPLADSSLAT